MKRAFGISLLLHMILFWGVWNSYAQRGKNRIFFQSSPVFVSLESEERGTSVREATKKKVEIPEENTEEDLGPPKSTKGMGSHEGSYVKALADVVSWGNLPPVYPEEALRREIEGEVHLRVFFSVRGLVEKIETLESSGFSLLDSAARQAALKWKLPIKQNLNNKEGRVFIVPIKFQLESG